MKRGTQRETKRSGKDETENNRGILWKTRETEQSSETWGKKN